MADHDRGAPISYMVLEEGTPVQTRDGVEVGRVRRVQADSGTDLFDGIVVRTDDGDRFVDAPEVGSIFERLVVLTVTHADLSALGEPPARTARRTWDRITGKL